MKAEEEAKVSSKPNDYLRVNQSNNDYARGSSPGRKTRVAGSRVNNKMK